MTTTKDKIIKLTIGSLVSDAIELHHITVPSLDQLIEDLMRIDGVIFNHNGFTYYEPTVTTPIGGSSIITDMGEIETGQYHIIEGRPEFVEEVIDAVSAECDILGVLKVTGCSMGQFLTPNFVDNTHQYKERLREVFTQIAPYVSLVGYPTDAVSKFEKADQKMVEQSQLSARLREFVNG